MPRNNASTMATISRARWIVYLGVSLAVLAPCFWQGRIQAGDLSSHIYNAWLVQLIHSGKASGLAVVRQTNNVLFDMLLSALLPLAGPSAAQRIAVSLAVLVFFWGAFALVWSSASRRGPREAPWRWAPCLAMLAYGWVYHMGLFNFYLALGLSMAAFALSDRKGRWTIGAAVGILGLAYVAHPLPPLWAASMMIYARISRGMRPHSRLLLAAGSLAGLAMLGTFVEVTLGGRWSPGQIFASTGADQIWVFGTRYLFLAGLVLLLWALSFQRVLAARGLQRTILDVPFQLCILNAASVALIPSIIVLPASGQQESLLVERLSLGGAVLFCALAASAPMGKWLAAGMAGAAVIFFCFVYADESALNRVEDKMERVVAQLPPGQRVVSALMDTNLRVFSLLHVIDRVCVGHCFSYGNYEHSAGQFRIRAERDNGMVVSDFRESWAIEKGGYVVKPRDLPLYRIDVCDASGRDLCVAPVKAGETLQRTWLRVTPQLWSEKGEAGS